MVEQLNVYRMDEQNSIAAQIYHRLESPTQTKLDALQQESSLQIWGRPPRGSNIAKVQAYVGPLPSGKRGIEFTTDLVPDSGSPPGYAFWSGPSSAIPVNDEGFAILNVLTLKNCQS